MITKPFFSIIVPCYNVEPYVRECLDSVLNQAFTNWECLVGVETSTDRTEEIVREYVSRDSRMKMFTGPRSGSCSASRNTGIDMAQGEYLVFLDGDDSIVAGSLLRLYNRISATPGADLYACAMYSIREKTSEIGINNNESRGVTDIWDNFDFSSDEMTGIEALRQYQAHHGFHIDPKLQLAIFRRDFVLEHNLKCLYGLRCQDNEFTYRALYFAKRLIPLHEIHYNYRIQVNSVQQFKKSRDYFHHDLAVIFRSLLAFYAKISKENGFKRHVASVFGRS